MTEAEGADLPSSGDRRTHRHWVAPAISWGSLAGIILTAVVGTLGRVLALDRLPGGLADVEAAHGLLARQAGDFGPYWMIESAGELSIPLASGIALLGALAGFDAETPRIVAALAGGLTLLFTGLWLRREIGPPWGLAGAAVLAGSFWHILFSRLALGQIIGAMTLAAALWCFSMMLGRQGPAASVWSLLAGLAVGVGFLATPVLRLLPALLIVLLAIAVYHEWRAPKRTMAWNALLATGATLLVIGPFLVANRGEIVAWTPRASTAGLPNDDRATLLTFPDAIIQTITGLVLSGSADRGLNLPSDPWYSPLMLPWAAVGLIGLIIASNDPGRRGRFLTGGALALTLLIGISAVNAGHPGQYLVVSPLLAGLVVYGFRTALNWERMTALRIALGAVLVVFAIAAEAYYSWDQYHDEWSPDPETRATLNAGLVDAVDRSRSLPPGEPVFLNAASGQVVLDYLEPPDRLHRFNGAGSLPFPEQMDGYLLNPHAASMSAPLEQLLDSAPLVNEQREGSYYSLYRLDDRIRQLMPFGVPTYQYPDGPALLGGRIAGVDDRALTVLVAWSLPVSSADYLADVRLSSVDAATAGNQTTVTIPENPLSSRLYWVVVAEVALPEDGAQADLEVRLLDAEGQPIRTGGADDEAFILLNRYQLPDR